MGGPPHPSLYPLIRLLLPQQDSRMGQYKLLAKEMTKQVASVVGVGVCARLWGMAAVVPKTRKRFDLFPCHRAHPQDLLQAVQHLGEDARGRAAADQLPEREVQQGGMYVVAWCLFARDRLGRDAVMHMQAPTTSTSPPPPSHTYTSTPTRQPTRTAATADFGGMLEAVLKPRIPTKRSAFTLKDIDNVLNAIVE